MRPRLSRWQWVVRSRQARERAVRIGECLGSLVEDLAPRAEVRTAIAGFVSEEFRSRCTLGSVNRDRIEILVSSPAACSALRLEWLTSLRQHLTRNCRGFGARRIVFRVGRSNDCFEYNLQAEHGAPGAEAGG